MPRHPPCALKHLQHKTKKMSFQKNCTSTHTRQTRTPKGPSHTACALDARNHYPQIKHHTPPPKQGNNTPPHPQARNNGPVVSGPNSVSGSFFAVAHQALAHYRREPLTAHTPPIGVFFVVLLKKEVTQPHLPVRLPCYDFVPIADPTFDGSLHKG